MTKEFFKQELMNVFMVPGQKWSLDQVYDNLHTFWTYKRAKFTEGGYLSKSDSIKFDKWLTDATIKVIANSEIDLDHPVFGDDDKIFDAFYGLIMIDDFS